MGDVRDRAMAIAMLVEAFGVKDFTPARVRAYEDGLNTIPIPLLNAAVRRAIQTRTFLPKVAELRTDAEACRRELLASNQYEPCAQCDETGWERVTVDGIHRVQRCGCWKRHQQKLAQIGVTSEPIALPPHQPEYVND
jgi:hypothetical protein